MYPVEDQIKANRRKIFFLVVTMTILAVLLVGVAFYVYRALHKTDIEKRFQEKEPFGILMIVKNEDDPKRPISFFSVVTVYPKYERLGFISFYPETRMESDEAPLTKRLEHSRIIDITGELSAKLGYSIPYHLVVNFSQIARFVDLIEGVDYFLWQPQMYGENSFPGGEFLLDGSMIPNLLTVSLETESAPAIQLFRHYSLFLNIWNDRQEKWEKLNNPKLWQIAAQDIETNLSLEDIIYFGEKIFSNDRWMPLFLEAAVKRKKDHFVLDHDATALYLKNFRKKLVSSSLLNAEDPPRLEIRNGTNINNLAKQYRGDLNRKGILVVEFSNADRHDYEHSILLNVSANDYYLQSVANSIGISRVYANVNKSLFTDMILILGKDYEKLKIER